MDTQREADRRVRVSDPESANTERDFFVNARSQSPEETHQALLSLSRVNRERVLNALDAKKLVEDLIANQIDDALRYAVQPQEGDAPLPDKEAIMTAIRRTITRDQAREIFSMRKQTLVLVPVMTWERWDQALTIQGTSPLVTGHALSNSSEQFYTDAQIEGNKIKKWKFAIVQEPQKYGSHPTDHPSRTLRQRRRTFRERLPAGMSAPDYMCFSAITVYYLLQGKRFGDGLSSILKDTDSESDEDQAIEDKCVVGIGAVGRYVSIFDELLDIPDGTLRVRFCASVMGEIEEIT